MKLQERYIELENFREIRLFMVEMMRKAHVTKKEIADTLLVFEALYNDLLEQGVDKKTMLKVSGMTRLGDLTLRIGYEGRIYLPTARREDATAEERVMGAFADKIDLNYFRGFNNISITVTRNHSLRMMLCLAGMLLSIPVYYLIRTNLSVVNQYVMYDQLVFPMEKVFTNAMLMIGTPVTLFSILKNMTDAYIVSARSSGMRKLQIQTLSTSVNAAMMAMTIGLVLAYIPLGGQMTVSLAIRDSNTTPAEFIGGLMPPSIIELLIGSNPVPLIILALLMVYAFCHAGKYFGPMKKAVEACYILFVRMLKVVMYTIPFFCFLACLDEMLRNGSFRLVAIFTSMLMVVVSMIALVLFYMIRLKVNGVQTGPFVKKLGPLLRENLIINSAIDAVPFNIRYCTTKLGLNRKRLEETMPVLAQINLDGNCFMITLMSIMFIVGSGIRVTWIDILVILLLVVFLSYGAPNQPGSMLIGLLFVINYLKAYDMIAMAILAEVFLGSILNITNVYGDVVSAAIDDLHLKQDAVKRCADGQN